MKPKVLFYVQHLLGVGHLKRAAAIAAAMGAQGLDVTVVHGGTRDEGISYPGASVHYLPSATIRGGDFSTLITANGKPADDAWRDARRDELLDLADRLRPAAVLFELFPFGRRQFRFELLPLIEAMRNWTPRPALLSSVRDILVRPVKASRETEAADLILASFDEVLVHGDPAFVPFESSFGEAKRIASKLRYTGYVSSDLSALAGDAAFDPAGEGAGEVVVSAGGGAVGATLLRAALHARPRSRAHSLDWQLIAGPRLAQGEFDALRHLAEDADADEGGRVRVERFRSDFQAVLKRAALSISQGGYNTTIDLLRAGVPAIVVPIGAEEETEQNERASRLASRGFLHVLPEAALAERLAGTIDATLADAPRRRAMPAADFALDGAANTARIVAEWVARAR
ncbi:glycosyltransferase family protein [Aureimonas leprariae]|uniref:Glycosyl transferase n=1 Tax=Plantimonas leprariae TaxID=2615207 RepID=A0A7V7PM94_9HYPH|nr:glycosyltransferase [Aureimonas leprariae]KAB0677758.1 glycosyl transferase [Aureimonas leprariae]